MTIIQGQVNNAVQAARASGSPSAMLLQLGELGISAVLPRFAALAWSGLLFYGANTAAQALSVDSTTFTGLAVGNPAGSGKNLVIVDIDDCAVGGGRECRNESDARLCGNGRFDHRQLDGPKGRPMLVGSPVDRQRQVGASGTLRGRPYRDSPHPRPTVDHSRHWHVGFLRKGHGRRCHHHSAWPDAYYRFVGRGDQLHLVGDMGRVAHLGAFSDDHSRPSKYRGKSNSRDGRARRAAAAAGRARSIGSATALCGTRLVWTRVLRLPSSHPASAFDQSSTFTGLAVGNPAGSGKNLVIIDVEIAQAAVGAAAVMLPRLGYATITALTTSNSSGPSGVSTIAGSGKNSIATVGSTATLLAAPTIIRPIMGQQWITGGTGMWSFYVKDTVDGAIVIPPGQILTIDSLVAAVTVLASVTWAELPV